MCEKTVVCAEQATDCFYLAEALTIFIAKASGTRSKCDGMQARVRAFRLAGVGVEQRRL